MSLPLLKAPKGWKRARYIYIKGVTERFGFDVVESRKFKLIVKNKATGTLHGMIICNPHWLFLVIVISWGCIIYSSAWGFQRCSFRLTGQCESLSIVERASDWLHVFLYVLTTSFSIRLFGATGAKHFRMRGLFASFRYFESWNQSVLIPATCKWLYPPWLCNPQIGGLCLHCISDTAEYLVYIRSITQIGH